MTRNLLNLDSEDNERNKLEKLQSEPVNVEFVGQDGNMSKDLKKGSYTDVFPKAAPGNDEYMDRDVTNEDIKQGNYTRVVKMVYDEVDPS